MSEAEAKVEAAPAEEKKVETPAVQADPYEGLTPEDRAAAEQFDTLIKTASPTERAVILRLAQEGNRAVAERQKAAEAAAEKKLETAVKNDAPDDKVAKLEKELAEIRKSMAEKEEAADRAQRVSQFMSTVNDVLDKAPVEIAEDAEIREEITDLAVGRAAKTRPADLRKMVQELVDKRVAREKKIAEEERAGKRREYATRKALDAAATKGDAGRGGAPARTDKKWTAEDFNSGKITDDVIKRFKEQVR